MARRVEALTEPSVLIVGGRILLDDFWCDDPVVVATIEEADDPNAAVTACLELGARATRAVKAGLDSHLVERAFDQLNVGFEATLTAATARIANATGELVDGDEGKLPVMFRELRGQLAEQLGTLFDPDSKSSALTLMETVFADAARQHGDTLRALLDPADTRSPLGQWKTEVLTVVRDQVGVVRSQVAELAERVAVGDARAEVLELTSGKGFTFEDRIHLELTRLAAPHGDVTEQVGRSGGHAASRVGDELVTVNPDDTGGQPASIVFEMKNRKLGMRKVLDELDRALAGREAQAAVAVFARADQAPTAMPFHQMGCKAIVIVEDSPQGLDLAYLWARWVARRALTQGTDELDFAAIETSLNDAAQALGRASTIRRCHTTAKKHIDLAGTELSVLVDEADQALDRLRLALR